MDDLSYSVDQLRRTIAETSSNGWDDSDLLEGLNNIDEKLEAISGSLFTIAEVMKERWDAENAPSEPVVLEEPQMQPVTQKRTLKRKGQ